MIGIKTKTYNQETDLEHTNRPKNVTDIFVSLSAYITR